MTCTFRGVLLPLKVRESITVTGSRLELTQSRPRAFGPSAQKHHKTPRKHDLQAHPAEPADRSRPQLTVNSPQENVFVSEQQTTSLPLTAETHRDWDIITPLLSCSCLLQTSC
ncbi:hypothetical protein WMY93_032235 [Mugilogobius chulae]|uniref:Uncharacterized protein n=1 Tax=Mugilogobius chulae TaxID=88201 RepID=A0AAW0MCK0_9GOBI